MKQQRLDGLADGIFAIVMTLLAFELKLPAFGGYITDQTMWSLLVQLLPSLISFVISFALLFTYWRAHHFMTSVYAKNLTVGLANINALFFFAITLVPFSASLLGTHPFSKVAIFVYGFNVIIIGLTLFIMRHHIETNPSIETTVITKADRRSGYIRILFPVFSACVAILVSYTSTSVSITLFALAILFNLVPESSNIIHRWLDVLFADDAEVIESNYSGKGNLLDDEEYVCVPKKLVFDHHRFQTLEDQKKLKNKSAKSQRKTKISEQNLEKKIEQEIGQSVEKTIEEEMEKGEAEDIIKKDQIESEE